MITRAELIAKRNEVCDILVSRGWDDDDARFATMTAAAKPDGILGDQAKAEAPELIELAKFAKDAQAPAPAKTIRSDFPMTGEFEDGNAPSR
jgi:hypothetical protein